MKTSVEQKDFSRRLQEALLNTKYPTDSPTQLAAQGGDSDDARMVADLQRLDEHYRTLAHEILRMLVRIHRRK